MDDVAMPARLEGGHLSARNRGDAGSGNQPVLGTRRAADPHRADHFATHDDGHAPLDGDDILEAEDRGAARRDRFLEHLCRAPETGSRAGLRLVVSVNEVEIRGGIGVTIGQAAFGGIAVKVSSVGTGVKPAMPSICM